MELDKESIVAVSGATKEVSKTTSKALDLTVSVGQFLHRVIGEPVEIASGTFIIDPLRELRVRRLDRLKRKTEQILAEREIETTRSVPPKVAVGIVEEASLEDDDTLLDLWASLLADAMNPSSEEPRRSHVEALKLLDPQDAQLATRLWNKFERIQGCISLAELEQNGVSQHDLVNLLRVGIVGFPILLAETVDRVKPTEDGTGVNISVENRPARDFTQIEFTDFGRKLLKILEG